MNVGDLFFMDDDEDALDFIICCNCSQKKKYLKKLIEDREGTVSFSLNDFGPYSAVLIDDNAKTWAHSRYVFNLSYIDACIMENCVVDISQFLHSKSKDLVPDFPYMDIIYCKKFSWFNIPAKYKLATNSNSEECMNLVSFKCSRCNINVNFRNKSTYTEQLKIVSTAKFGETKRTRMKYSTQENEAILKYIVENDLHEHVKGVSMWKAMEAKNICPIRTWQSMKEHARTILPKELHKYTFLKSNDIHLLRKSLYK